MAAKNAEPAAGATPTRSSPPKIAITPTRFSLSPGAGQEFQLDGCKLEVQCEAPAPRLLLKRGKKHEGDCNCLRHFSDGHDLTSNERQTDRLDWKCLKEVMRSLARGLDLNQPR